MTVKLTYYFISYFAAAFVLVLALTPLIRTLAFKLGAVDTGIGRRVHTGRIPRLGGASIFLAFMLPLVFSLTRGAWDGLHHDLTGIFIASTMVLCIGIYDDLRGATVRNKLLAEALAAALIYSWGIRITAISNPFGSPIALGWLSLPVTVLWVIVVANAVNLIDGLDGLAAGTGILISLTLFSLAADTHVQVVFIVLAGSLAGFLVYNFPPASIFMGDSGSLFLGFFLGAVSVLSLHKATAIATIMIPIVAFSFPLMDMLYAVIRRYYRGIPLGNADREHIHHKLLDKGLSKRKVLFFLYFINIAVMMAVLMLVRRQLNIDFLGLVLLVAFAVLGLRVFGYIDDFIPFMKDIKRNYDISRKSKYFRYVIKRFRRNAAKSGSSDELKTYLSLLMKEFNFSTAEIYLFHLDGGTLFYTYNSETVSRPKNPLILSFPIAGRGGPLGNVYISRHMGDDYFLCGAELVSALSEELSRFG